MSDDFGTRLNQIMDEHNVTAVAVARAIGCSAQAVSKWLKGGNIEYSNLRSLSEYLQVDWIWLRYGDEAIKERILAHDEADFIRHIRADTIRRLMENEERLALVVDAARLGIWDWDIFTNEFRWSPEMADLFGLGRQTLTTTPEGLLARIHPDDVGSFLRRARAAYNSASDLRYEFRIVREDGEIRWVLCAGRYYKDRFEKVVRSLGMMMDITTRKFRETENKETTTALADTTNLNLKP